jgi:hypothetical protein
MQRLEQQGPDPADEHRRVPVHATDRPVLGEPALASGLVELPSACRALRPGDALEDGRADPATESICGTQVSHLLIINPFGQAPSWPEAPPTPSSGTLLTCRLTWAHRCSPLTTS